MESIFPINNGWLPIETAPNDGTIIDLWTNHGQREANCKWENGSWRYYWINSFESLEWIKIDDIATHWMPIPGAPRIEQ